jgi:hypothetical protein
MYVFFILCTAYYKITTKHSTYTIPASVLFINTVKWKISELLHIVRKVFL